MKSRRVLLSALVLLLLGAALLSATGQKEGAAARSRVTFFWALYDGLTEEYRLGLQDAFMKANPNIQADIVPVDWDQMETKLTTAVAGGNPPEISVIGTRWLLEYMASDSVVQVTDYVSKATIDNIAPGAREASIGGKLMGLPIAAGARIMAVNNAITQTVPATMEELRQEAIRVNNPPNVSGFIMPGKLHTELTDFCYFLYAAGGDFFEKKPDGSFGKSVFNGPAGVKALEFMVQLANQDKVVPAGYLSLDRMDVHPLFYEGKGAYVFIGAWAESAMKQAGSTFPVTYAQIPPFQGQKQQSLIITDSVAMFKKAKNLEGAGKFLDFFYTDAWKAKFDEAIGFPPVTMSAAKLPQFQTPLYKALGEAALNAKGWPLMEGFAQISDIIWNANVKAFLGQMSPKQALDEAAAQIDKMRGM
jgi:multiple sugar transport system substrate-binding protein